MGYYEEKKRELTELLRLLRKEKTDFENIAKIEREAIDKNVRLLNELGIYDEKDSEFKKLIEAKDRLNLEKSEFEISKQVEISNFNEKINRMKAEIDSYSQNVDQQLEQKREKL
ncbi:MAG: hypothetical protein WBC55_01300, partial [Dehalococcoidia bacterium]